MVDVDFRFVERQVEYGEFFHLDSNSMRPSFRTEKVLQWRKKILTAPLRYPEEPKIAWTDWQDVRTEQA